MTIESGYSSIKTATIRAPSCGRARDKMPEQSILLIDAETVYAHETHTNPFLELTGTATKIITNIKK